MTVLTVGKISKDGKLWKWMDGVMYNLLAINVFAKVVKRGSIEGSIHTWV